MTLFRGPLVSSLSFGILLLAPAASAQTLFGDQGTGAFNNVVHWTNFLQVDDLDNDGDLDVIFANCGGFFNSSPGAQPLLVYTNDGMGGFTEASQATIGDHNLAVRQVAIGDVDQDGDLDLYVPNAGGQADKFFINNGQGVFADEAATRLPGVSSRAGATRFGDIDNDGDLDLLVADGYGLGIGPVLAHVYRNDGSGVFAEDTDAVPANVPGYDPDDMDFVDVDRDFDLDLLINMHAGKSVLWINDGSGNFADESERLAAMPGGINGAFDSPFHYGPVTCDVDGDGDLDIWTDNVASQYQEQLMINNGSGMFTDETNQRVTGNAAGADDNGLACVDVDNDGDFDAVVMSLSNVERILLNDGTGKFTGYPGGFSNVSDSTLWFDFGDLTGDGRLDVVTGQGEFGEQRNRLYFGTNNAPQDTRDPNIIAVETLPGAVMPGETVVMRFAVSDAVVTNSGPRLTRSYIIVDGNEIDATFMGGDLFRGAIDTSGMMGDITISACAEDRQGNVGCSGDQVLKVSTEATASATTSVGVGGAGGAGSAAGGNGAAVSGAGGGGGGFQVDDDGCGCVVVQPKRSTSWYWLTLAAGAVAWVRRRRAS